MDEDNQKVITDEIIHIVNSGLRLIPDSVLAHLNTNLLTSLHLQKNKLTNLPDPSSLPSLTLLNVSHNRLTFIPTYPGLVELNLSNNPISSLPRCKIQHLTCDNTQVKRLPTVIKENVVTISISGCPIVLPMFLPVVDMLFADSVPWVNNVVDVSDMPRITVLDVDNSKVNYLAESVKNSQIVEFHVEKCNIPCSNLPTNLVALYANHSSIDRLPPLPKLEIIEAENTPLTSLSDQTYFPALTEIRANGSKLKKIRTFPLAKVIVVQNGIVERVNDQPSLIRCCLNNNAISQIGNFPNAEEMQLDKNQIRTFQIFPSCTNLTLSENSIDQLTFVGEPNDKIQLLLPLSVIDNIALQTTLRIYLRPYRQMTDVDRLINGLKEIVKDDSSSESETTNRLNLAINLIKKKIKISYSWDEVPELMAELDKILNIQEKHEVLELEKSVTFLMYRKK